MMADKKNSPETAPDKQMDDNIDDMGRKPDGSTLEQPGTKSVRRDSDPAQKDVEPGSDADSDNKSLGV